jgi:hypothetical protein
MPRRLAQFDSDSECIDAEYDDDDDDDDDAEDEDDDDEGEEEEEEEIEELSSPSKSPYISRLRNNRRGNQSSCHGEQRSNVVRHFYCRRLTENPL